MARACGDDNLPAAGQIALMQPVIPIILLAAGQSTRMRGVDKLLQPVDGQPMLRRTAKRLRAATSGPVIVVLPPAPHPRHDALAGLDLVRVEAARARDGLSESLRAGLAALPDTAEAVMIMLADLPDLTETDIRTVLQAVHLKSKTLIWRGATEGLKPGHPVVFSRRLEPELRALTGDDGAASIIRRHAGRVELVPLPGQRALLDLDTPEDWAAWRAKHNRP
jgi:CTP:molybdopterin cytidylyltransferase MocA